MGTVTTTEPATTESANQDAIRKWEDQNEKAFSIISVTIKDDQIGHIQDCTTSKEAWDKLAAVHQGIGIAGRMVLRQRLISLRLEEGCTEETLRQHLDSYRTLVTQMKSLGEVIEDGEPVNWLFISLPASFEPLVMAL